MTRTYLPVVEPILVDRQARQIRYLRVSLTDRCNYRCTYCMPEEGFEHRARPEVLDVAELERLARVFAGVGVRKLRLTGGEPTVRAGVVDIVARLAAVPGIEHVAMTSNGHLLEDLAAPLAAAGLRSINVSLDTTDAARFAAVTGRGDLARVLAGVAAARAAGLEVKLNAVALRGVNDDEYPALVELGWRLGAPMRFIEHMPLSAGSLFHATALVPAAEIRARIGDALGAVTAVTSDARDGGPARYYTVAARGDAGTVGADPARRFGIISAMTEHFCDDCNRLRLSATGGLHACLGYDDETDLRALVRGGADDDALAAAIRTAVSGKRPGHGFLPSGQGGPKKHMTAIGG